MKPLSEKLSKEVITCNNCKSKWTRKQFFFLDEDVKEAVEKLKEELNKPNGKLIAIKLINKIFGEFI